MKRKKKNVITTARENVHDEEIQTTHGKKKKTIKHDENKYEFESYY